MTQSYIFELNVPFAGSVPLGNDIEVTGAGGPTTLHVVIPRHQDILELHIDDAVGGTVTITGNGESTIITKDGITYTQLLVYNNTNADIVMDIESTSTCRVRGYARRSPVNP